MRVYCGQCWVLSRELAQPAWECLWVHIAYMRVRVYACVSVCVYTCVRVRTHTHLKKGSDLTFKKGEWWEVERWLST